MKRMFAGICGALLVFGLVGALSGPASAGGRGYDEGDGGGYSDGGCNCNGPVTQVVNAGTQVVTSRRVITTNRVIPRVRVIDRNRVVLHRRTIVHRQIVVHRRNTIEKNITVNRINTAHKFQTVHRNQVQNVNENTRSRTSESRTVKGKDCNCAPGQANYRGAAAWKEHQDAIRSRN